MKLSIIGTIGLDDVRSPFGEVNGALGGSGVYASCAASFFVSPALISIMGKDMPEVSLATLKKRGINLDGVAISEKTFRWTGSYEYDMNEAKTHRTELNSLQEFKPTLLPAHKESEFLFLGNIDPDLQLEALNQVSSKPFVVIDTMNYWISSKKDALIEVIKRVNCVVLNEGEARQLFDTPNLIKAGKALLELGPEYAIIKKGEHGALLFSFNDFFSAPGYPLEEVKDPTGAGDSFAGGMIGYLAKIGTVTPQEMRKAIIYGSAIASFCAEDFSLNYLDKTTNKDVKERYDTFKSIRKF
ncbi:MAG: PfkB family carbohydrate kinase [Patescibacteria group bacterium]|jgi:ribokinase